jgi:NADPH:quinone reductase-like Zn-dependent oxidoreductase
VTCCEAASVSRMRAAVLHELGGTPRVGEFEEPVAGDGQAIVEVALAGMNPVDVRKASGLYVTGPPPLPSVVGTEGVGTLAGSGRRVYFEAAVPPFGSMAERVPVYQQATIDLPDAIDDELAVALGIAGLAGWLPLAWRARLQPGERVLVLGATGVVGQVAVQAAKLLGAGRVVAAGRDRASLERALALGADAAVDLASAADELPDAFRAAAGGDLDVVVDPLWGDPGRAALQALGVGGRLVQLGESAGAEAGVASATVRGKALEILGYINMLVPAEVRHDAYRQLVEHGAAGRLALKVERMPLEQVEQAWARQQAAPHRKLVLAP